MRKLTTEEFIEKAKLIHGDKYDYSLSEYLKAHNKVKIICPTHGIFEQTGGNHLFGQGCSYCANIIKRNTLISNSYEFIEKAKKFYENKYDYSKINYINSLIKVNIICPIHGDFNMLPSIHLIGQGCPKCGIISRTNKQRSNTENFINKSELIHKNKYDYSLVNYVNNKTKIKIICPTHGEFEQRPSDHLTNVGCPICNESKGEKEIREYLINKNITFKKQHTFNECKHINTLPFDFYLPELNICIEYQGRQHYESIEYFGGEKYFDLQQKRDKIKIQYCRDNNIELVIMKYNDNINEKLNSLNTRNIIKTLTKIN